MVLSMRLAVEEGAYAGIGISFEVKLSIHVKMREQRPKPKVAYSWAVLRRSHSRHILQAEEACAVCDEEVL